MTNKKEKLDGALAWLEAVSIGSLWTALGFYWVYDQWRPVVLAACIVALIRMFYHFMAVVEGFEP